jgi:Fur family transcriptional regulator, ferric uptake regulator
LAIETRGARSAFGPLRLTAQRATIFAAAQGLGRAFTVDDLVLAARAQDASLGIATVYRAVGALVSSGWVERVGERDGSSLYALCAASGHHHHVVCTACGRTEHAECPLGAASELPSTASGFVVPGHEITLYGLCPACATEARD